jgi:hypothetical protein
LARYLMHLKRSEEETLGRVYDLSLIRRLCEL